MNQFIKITGEIKTFLETLKTPINIPELSDIDLLTGVSFFADMTKHLPKLNLKLQITIVLFYLMSSGYIFKNKLMFEHRFRYFNFDYH